MEHTLGVNYVSMFTDNDKCLNPCFNGTYSRSRLRVDYREKDFMS